MTGTASPAAAQPGVTACTAETEDSSGGSVIANPRTSLLFWGAWDSGTASDYASSLQTLSGTSAFFNRMAEYGVGNGTFGQRLPDYTAVTPGYQSECALVGQLVQLIGAAGIVPDSNNLFVMMLASTSRSRYDHANNARGHHASTANTMMAGACRSSSACSYTSKGSLANTCTDTGTGTTYPLTVNGTLYNIRYAIVDQEFNPVVTASHEIAEAATDPDKTTYTNEIGDMCEGKISNVRGVATQKIWSQSACRCVGVRDLNSTALASGSISGGASSVPTVYDPSLNRFYVDSDRFYYPVGSSSLDTAFVFDHDGDGRPDYSVVRSSGTVITSRQSSPPYTVHNYTFGTPGDAIVPGDYDGDGKSDLAAWTPSTGNWTVVATSTGVTTTTQWGVSTDIPIPGDYDGDGITDMAVLRPSEQKQYILLSSMPGYWTWAIWVAFASGDIPTPADYNGDGLTDFAFWRPSTATFYVWYENTNVSWSKPWGAAHALPVVRDYDGDWLADLATVQQSGDDFWSIFYSSDGSTHFTDYGSLAQPPVQQFTASGGF
ncbi:MAG: VCBS repeat-containing protein [Polyangiaceae bacterium]